MSVAIDEWDAVTAAHDQLVAQEQAQAQNAPTGSIRAAALVHRGTPIHFVAARDALCTDTACSLVEARIQFLDLRAASTWRRTKYALFGLSHKLKHNSPIQRDRLQIFSSALIPFDHTEILHERVMCSCWKALTGDELAPAQFGHHWESIGFQGSDPSTDLRGAGMLGLLQLLAFAQQHSATASRILALSNDSSQHFPFAVVSLQWTGLVLLILRQGRLFGASERAGSMWQVANDMHAAILLQFYLTWKRENATIVDFARIKTQLQRDVIANPKSILAQLYKSVKSIQGEAGEKLEFVSLGGED